MNNLDLPYFLENYWPVLLVIILGGAAVYLLLPRPQRFPYIYGAAAGIAALATAGVLLIQAESIWVESVLFYVFAGLAILSGGVMITQTQPVRAALSFALVVLSTCGLFLLQAAPFLMAATIIVYAGAIVVTFLFVIMLAQQSGLSNADYRSREPMLACVAGFVLLGALLCVLLHGYRFNNNEAIAQKLDAPLRQIDKARRATSREEIKEILTEPDKLFGSIEKQAESVKKQFGDKKENKETNAPPIIKSKSITAFATLLEAACQNASQSWLEEHPLEKVHDDLSAVYDQGTRLQFALQGALQPPPELHLSPFSGAPANRVPARDRSGRAYMPADNVAAVGRSLFTDYLLPVELAGVLLLVATIGAIVIAGRRSERLR